MATSVVSTPLHREILTCPPSLEHLAVPAERSAQHDPKQDQTSNRQHSTSRPMWSQACASTVHAGPAMMEKKGANSGLTAVVLVSLGVLEPVASAV